MIARRRSHAPRIAAVAALVIASAFVAMPRAELGVVHGGVPEPGNDPIPYILGAITDEGNPIEIGWWQRSFADSPTRSVLNPDGDTNGDGRPDVVLHPTTRVPLVVWARNSPGGFEVVSSTFEGGAWTDPVVLAGLAGDALDPRVAVDAATGEVHLVYWVDDVEPRVEHRSAPADLSVWSAAQPVSGVGEAACRPHVVVHDGMVRVAYEVHVPGAGGTPRQIVLSRLESGGFVQEIVAQTGHDGIVRPEVHSHIGRIWVDWVDGEGLVGWTRFDPVEEAWTTIRTEPFSGVEEREFHVRGAVRAQAIE